MEDALNAILIELRRRHQPVPRPRRRAAPQDIDAAEQALGRRFRDDYRVFLAEAADLNVGTLEPFSVVTSGSHIDLVSEVRDAWDTGVPIDLLPFCGDNGNYFCLAKDGTVVYWDHNGPTHESWSNLAEWIRTVWIGED